MSRIFKREQRILIEFLIYKEWKFIKKIKVSLLHKMFNDLI